MGCRLTGSCRRCARVIWRLQEHFKVGNLATKGKSTEGAPKRLERTVEECKAVHRWRKFAAERVRGFCSFEVGKNLLQDATDAARNRDQHHELLLVMREFDFFGHGETPFRDLLKMNFISFGAIELG